MGATAREEEGDARRGSWHAEFEAGLPPRYNFVVERNRILAVFSVGCVCVCTTTTPLVFARYGFTRFGVGLILLGAALIYHNGLGARAVQHDVNAPC